MGKNKGLTLIELIICLLIISITSLFGISSYQSIQEKNQIQIRESILKQAILYSKQQAFVLKKRLVLAGLNEGDWSSGLILYIDKNDHRYSEPAQLIRQWNFQTSSVSIQWKGFYSKNHLLFTPDFRQSALNGQFEIAGKEGLRRVLIVNRLGRIRVEN